MNENFDIRDTTPEISNEETENIENGEEDIVTPNDDKLSLGDVERDAETLSAQKSASENTDASKSFVSVQYNHKTRNFTKEEAVEYIQKGMHTEALRAKLEYLAKSRGTTVNSIVEEIVSAPENAYRAHLEQVYGKGSSTVERGMAAYRKKQSDEYKQLMSEGESSVENEEKIKSVNSRLADEYIDLKAEMPDAPEYSNLPDSVIIEAAEGKRDLCSAYLRYLHKEKTKINSAKSAQEAAANATSGTMGKNSTDDITSAERNFLSGLWGK